MSWSARKCTLIDWWSAQTTNSANAHAQSQSVRVENYERAIFINEHTRTPENQLIIAPSWRARFPSRLAHEKLTRRYVSLSPSSTRVWWVSMQFKSNQATAWARFFFFRSVVFEWCQNVWGRERESRAVDLMKEFSTRLDSARLISRAMLADDVRSKSTAKENERAYEREKKEMMN